MARMISIDDLYARADRAIHEHAPHRTADTLGELHAVIAEAVALGQQIAQGEAPPCDPQGRNYIATVRYLTEGGHASDTITFTSRNGPLATERAADLEALRRFGSEASPYVIRTSIRRV